MCVCVWFTIYFQVNNSPVSHWYSSSTYSKWELDTEQVLQSIYPSCHPINSVKAFTRNAHGIYECTRFFIITIKQLFPRWIQVSRWFENRQQGETWNPLQHNYMYVGKILVNISGFNDNVLYKSCWLGGRKGIQSVKNWVVGCCMVICLERGADLHMVQLMPLPLTVLLQ